MFTPTPGGGTSNPATLTVVGPGISLNVTTAPLTGPVVATMSNGPGRAGEWIGVYSAAGGGYVDWQWITGGQGPPGSAADSVLTFPTGAKALAAGQYVLRWWSAGQVIAQSAVFTLEGAQVRFLNDLVICNPDCNVSFTARLTASEGYTWFSTSGSYSPYQAVTTSTLSNFTGEAIGYGVNLNFPGAFAITLGRRYALIVTLDAADNVVLLQVDEGSIAALGESPAVGAAIPGATVGAPTLRFAPVARRSR